MRCVALCRAFHCDSVSMCVCIHVGVRTVGSVCVCRWRKLNVVHFSLLEVATALDFDEVLYLWQGRGRKKQLNKKYNIQNSDRNCEPKVPERQL